MALLFPLTTDRCNLSVCDELGPAQVTLTPYCRAVGPDSAPLVIKCSDQRDDLELMMGLSYIDVPNQCSDRPRRRSSSSKMTLNVSLGCAATNPKILAALLGTEVETDADDTLVRVVPIRDGGGKPPDYWEVKVEPLVDGVPSTEWRIVMLYAYTVVDNGSLMFSPRTPRSLRFTLEAENHPTENDLGQFWFRGARFA